MAQALVLAGADCRVSLGGQAMNEVQSISYIIDYGEEEIMGIDSIHPQEIAATKMTVSGTISGLRIKGSGGTQAKKITPLVNEIMQRNYISIKIDNPSTGYAILFIPNAKITREDVSVTAKGTVKFNLTFKGILALQELDIAGPL
jgi:hypothetical protein